MNFQSYRGKISALFKEAKNSLFQKKKCNKLSNSSIILKIQKIKIVAQSFLDNSVLIYVISAVLVIFHFCTCCCWCPLLKMVPWVELCIGYGGESLAGVIITLCTSPSPMLHFIQEKVGDKGTFWEAGKSGILSMQSEGTQPPCPAQQFLTTAFSFHLE